MSKRIRSYAMLAIGAVLALLYSRIGGDWSDVAFYGIGALLLALSGLSLVVWVEMAPDGAFRGRPRG